MTALCYLKKLKEKDKINANKLKYNEYAKQHGKQ